ncbi:MAG: tetratricopeptide repeat protein [Desulfatitalea sp.]|nr:tetratricopeptide repeat protein [Desulfatitalea sp.]
MKNKKNITIAFILFLVTIWTISSVASDGPDRKSQKFFKKGKAAFETSDYEKAGEYLKQAIKQYPDYADAYFLLGRIALAEKDVKEAFDGLSKAISADPGHVKAQLALGRLFLAAGRPSEALARAEAAHAHDPTNRYAWLIQSSALIALNKNAEASKVLEKIIEDDPADIQSRIVVANAYLQQKKIERAEAILRKGLDFKDDDAKLRLALGELCLKTKRVKEAVEILQKGLSPDSNTTETGRIDIQNALARIYLAARDYPAAKQYARGVLDLDPENIQALVTRGKTFAASGDARGATIDFHRVLEARPNDPAVYLLLADAYNRNRQTAQAREILRRGLDAAPDNAELHMAMYRVCLGAKDYKKAETHLRTIVEKNAKAIAAQAELGDFYLVLNDEAAAGREFSEIMLKAPRSDLGYSRLARLYARQGEREKAIAQLKTGIAMVENNQALTTQLASLFIADKRYDEAAALCDERLKKNDREAFAHNLKGIVYTRMKNYKAAQTFFEKATEIDPMWPNPGNNLAVLYLLQEKKEQAVKHFEAALDRNPKNPTAYLALGRLYEEKGKFDAAIENYEKAVKQVSGFWAAANRLAFLLADQATSSEMLERAEKIAAAAFHMKPGHASIIDTLGWIQYKKGDADQALQLYEQLIVALPEDPVVNYHMGMVLEKTGDTEEAMKKLKVATRGDEPFVGRDRAEAMLKELTAKG